MKRTIRWIALFALIAASPVLRAAEAPLTLGVFPYVTRGQLMEFHTPLRLYLEKHLQRPVEMVTAPDFVEFMNRTQKGEYDLVLTAPHLGRLAETRDGYVRVAKTGHQVYGVFLARKDSGIRSLTDLKGKTIMMAQPVSIVYQMGVAELRKNGLEPGKDITVIGSRTHNNALYAPARKESDASVTGLVLWTNAEPDLVAQLVEIGRTHGVPGFMVMANKRVPPELVKRIQSALLEFHKTNEGKPYFDATEFKFFEKIDDKSMKQLDPYTRVLTEPAP
jgi:phosphonate transport system substrate-binding protein